MNNLLLVTLICLIIHVIALLLFYLSTDEDQLWILGCLCLFTVLCQLGGYFFKRSVPARIFFIVLICLSSVGVAIFGRKQIVAMLLCLCSNLAYIFFLIRESSKASVQDKKDVDSQNSSPTSQHTRNKLSWSGSLKRLKPANLSRRRSSIIDFSGYQQQEPAKGNEAEDGTCWVQALYDYRPEGGARMTELEFRRGEHLKLLEWRGNWWWCKKQSDTLHSSRQEGFVPSNYVQVLKKARITKSPPRRLILGRRRHYSVDADKEIIAERRVEGELPLLGMVQVGQIVEVLEEGQEWWIVRGVDARVGRVPRACLEPIMATYQAIINIMDKNNKGEVTG